MSSFVEKRSLSRTTLLRGRLRGRLDPRPSGIVLELEPNDLLSSVRFQELGCDRTLLDRNPILCYESMHSELNAFSHSKMLRCSLSLPPDAGINRGPAPMGALLGAPKAVSHAFLCRKVRHKKAVGNCHRNPSAGKSWPGDYCGPSEWRTDSCKSFGRLIQIPFPPSPSKWLGWKGIRIGDYDAGRRAPRP